MRCRSGMGRSIGRCGWIPASRVGGLFKIGRLHAAWTLFDLRDNAQMHAALIGLVTMAAFLMLPLRTCRAQGHIKVDVDLAQLHGTALLDFLRAAVPQVWGSQSQPPPDLPTLLSLHSRTQANAGWLKPEELAWNEETQNAL